LRAKNNLLLTLSSSFDFRDAAAMSYLLDGVPQTKKIARLPY